MASMLAGTALAQDILVRGNERVAKDFIAAQFPKGGPKNEADVDAGLKALHSTGQFEDIKISRLQHGITVVTVTEAPLVNAIVFNGNKRLKDDQLASLVGFKPGDAITDRTISQAESALRAAYDKTGRNDARIKAKEITDNGRANIEFNIDEGAKTKIEKIYFTGNDHITENNLRGAITTKESGLVTSVLNKDVYDVDQVDRDRVLILDYYKARGYADVSVSDPDVTFDPENASTMIGFHINEGKRYEIGAVSVESTVAGFETRDLRPSYRAGGLYDPQEIERLRSEVEKEVATVLPGTADLSIRTSRNQNGTMDVVYTVDKGENVYIERIDIVGNHQTHDYVIRRELDFSEGDRIEPRQIREAERRLKALRFFKSIDIRTARAAASDRAVMTVTVEEDKTGEFSIGTGYSTADGIIGTVGISQANFMGSGRYIGFEVGRGDDDQSYSFSMTEPHLFGTRATGFIELYHRNIDFDSNRFHPYDETRTGGKIGIRAPITNDLTGSIYFGLYDREIADVPLSYQGSGLANSPFLIEVGNTLVSFAGYSLNYNTLDDNVSPANGLTFSFDQEFAGLGGDVAWAKTEAKLQYFTEIDPRNDVVGSLGFKAGNILGLGEDLNFVDHLRNDAHLVRGFARGGIGPRDMATGYNLGGQFYIASSAETSMPLPFVPDSMGLRGLVFLDAGTVFNPDKDSIKSSGASVLSEGFSLRAATGAGISWDSPFGMIKASVAVPLAKEEEDKAQWFSFSAGSRF